MNEPTYSLEKVSVNPTNGTLSRLTAYFAGEKADFDGVYNEEHIVNEDTNNNIKYVKRPQGDQPTFYEATRISKDHIFKDLNYNIFETKFVDLLTTFHMDITNFETFKTAYVADYCQNFSIDQQTLANDAIQITISQDQGLITLLATLNIQNTPAVIYGMECLLTLTGTSTLVFNETDFVKTTSDFTTTMLMEADPAQEDSVDTTYVMQEKMVTELSKQIDATLTPSTFTEYGEVENAIVHVPVYIDGIRKMDLQFEYGDSFSLSNDVINDLGQLIPGLSVPQQWYVDADLQTPLTSGRIVPSYGFKIYGQSGVENEYAVLAETYTYELPDNLEYETLSIPTDTADLFRHTSVYATDPVEFIGSIQLVIDSVPVTLTLKEVKVNGEVQTTSTLTFIPSNRGRYLVEYVFELVQD